MYDLSFRFCPIYDFERILASFIRGNLHRVLARCLTPDSFFCDTIAFYFSCLVSCFYLVPSVDRRAVKEENAHRFALEFSDGEVWLTESLHDARGTMFHGDQTPHRTPLRLYACLLSQRRTEVVLTRLKENGHEAFVTCIIIHSS